jgi:[protein-PII] uridylyltransferase
MISNIIEELLGPNGLEEALSTKETTAIKAYKSAVTSFQQYLQDSFDPLDSNVESLTRLRSSFVDQLLKKAWLQYFDVSQSHAALVAVGGYGRSELFPGSDIDLMVLTGRLPTQGTLDKLQQFLTFLWDIGLEVGHSVRTVRDAFVEAKADITVATNIMESRLLLGNIKLFESMQKTCGPKKIWPSQPFFLAKHQEQIDRYAKYDDTAYKLEPNLKESPGGLRDIQNIAWVAKRHFGATSLKELVEHQYLTEDEYQLLYEGLNYLGTLRMALHLHTNRREDRILFDHQRALASQFGYSGEGNKPIEDFMQHYFRTVLELQRLNEMLLQHFQDEIDLKPRWGRKQIIPINKRFQSRRGFIEVKYDKVFEHYPFALLEIFLILEQHPELKGVTAATIRLIRQYRDTIDNNYRRDARAKGFFMEILKQPQGITHELRRMNRYGVLAAYLPEFANIVGRMQYDLFHTYTVDAHTLFVVRNLRRFTVPEFKHEFPLCSQIMATLPKPELVYIAGLYHDIAKGRGGDHAILGAIDARNFCERHGLGEYDTNMVAWLIENHLLMSQTSQKQDITDADVINNFATIVADGVRLNYLYVLTVADMRATNPSLWNSWKANLLNELYGASNRLYRHGMGSAELEAHRLTARRSEAREQLVQSGLDEKAIEDFWSRLPDKYFLRHAVDDIIWHSQSLIERNFTPIPIVCSRADNKRGITAIFIYANDQANLFAHTASALAQLNLNILDARIMETDDSYALNTFIVHNDDGKPIIDARDLKSIEDRIYTEISRPFAPASQVNQRIPRTLKQFSVKTFVDFEQDDNSQRTTLKLVTIDQPGILSLVGQVFIEHNIRLHTAQVATFGERVEDYFYISTPDKQQITDENKLEDLRQSIIKTLNSET